MAARTTEMDVPEGTGWVVAVLTAAAAYAKARWDAHAQIASAEEETRRAIIGADSSAEISLTDRLFAHIEDLRRHNAGQDKAHVELLAQIGELRASVAQRDAIIAERDRQIGELIEKLDKVKTERNAAFDELRKAGLIDFTEPIE